MSDSPAQSPRRVPAAHGIAWLVQSLQLLRLQAARLLFIAVLMQLLLALTQVPVLGLLVILAVPALSAGILEAFHRTALGERPAVMSLFRPLLSARHNGRLLALGALVFLVGVLSIALVLSGEEVVFDPAVISRIEQGEMSAMAELDQASIRRLALALLIGVSISGTLSYFTVPLIWFRRRGVGPALAEGLKALVLNWRPFLALAVGLAALLIFAGFVTAFLFTLAASGGVLSLLAMALVMLWLLAVQLILFGTQYCSFRDVFDFRDQVHPPPEPRDDDQLVA